ncbi:hypothetical protein BKG92_07710 [Rodentibacter ratti]|uniref:Uncharacterized protein n=1 Tax=Rodentibacter ratti TaxID=1906745 RepID=A0A1V3KWB7_9PAST|nr:hypothetical protein [Rodentibacter ratti]OOF81996.1 hypothetical protein BKG92_07710 [Rodentibacter ratti]
MSKLKEWLFDTDISSGKIIVNTSHNENIQQLAETILSSISDRESILLNYWTYRLYDDVIIHVLDFMTLSDQPIYTLTLTEGDEICFYPHSFISNQGSVTVIDTVDVNGLLHRLGQVFQERNIRFIFSFLDMNR